MSADFQNLCSMTGFARTEGARGETQWSWEIKSVNSKGLEARFRMPSGFDFLEASLRKALGVHITRGSVNAMLTIRSGESATHIRVNENALEQILPMVDKIGLRIDCEKPRAENILNIRGVLEQVEAKTDQEEKKALGQAVAQSFTQVVERLKQARLEEGGAMGAALGAHVDEIARLAQEARAHEEATPAVIRDRLAAQIEDLLSNGAVTEERLAQEVALLAVKADIREELDRLDAHVEAARALLSGIGPVGRKLDFLTQEFNREANTLCAKASGMALKRIGLDLKSVIDQMREQVQNVE